MAKGKFERTKPHVNVALSNPATILNEVVFPHPEGPNKVVKVPGSKVQLTLSTATV